MDLKDKNEQKKKGALTPIVDGDARPDININPEEDEKRDRAKPASKEKDKFTVNREDKNSLEDYKDAKQ